MLGAKPDKNSIMEYIQAKVLRKHIRNEKNLEIFSIFFLKIKDR